MKESELYNLLIKHGFNKKEVLRIKRASEISGNSAIDVIKDIGWKGRIYGFIACLVVWIVGSIVYPFMVQKVDLLDLIIVNAIISGVFFLCYIIFPIKIAIKSFLFLRSYCDKYH